MSLKMHEPGGGMVSQLWRGEAYLRQEFSRIGIAAMQFEGLEAPSRLETLLARERPHPEALQAAREKVAASAAILPITPQMAWAVPQLLKRAQLASPGVVSTTGVLRSLIRMPERDEQFAQAFADSGFLACDRTMERASWKYDIGEMKANQSCGAWQVLEHCRAILAHHRTKQPVDWDGVLTDLRTLMSWFPELRTLGLLEQLYGRLSVLHMKSILVAQQWLEWRAEADATPDCRAPPAPARANFAFLGAAHA